MLVKHLTSIRGFAVSVRFLASNGHDHPIVEILEFKS